MIEVYSCSLCFGQLNAKHRARTCLIANMISVINSNNFIHLFLFPWVSLLDSFKRHRESKTVPS